MNALGDGRELAGGNGEVEQSVPLAHPLLDATLDVQVALGVFVLIQLCAQFGEIFV